MFKIVVGNGDVGFVVIPGVFEGRRSAEVFADYHFGGRDWSILPTTRGRNALRGVCG